MSTDELSGLARSAGVVGYATLASRVTGFLRDIVFANAFLPAATDAFFVAFTIPNLFRRFVGEGSLTVAFVPVFTGWLQRSREEAREVLSAVWTLGLATGVAITVGGMLLADPLIQIFAPGFALEPGKQELAAALLQLCFPYILFMVLVAVTMGALNSMGHFLVPAIAPVLLNVCLVAGAWVGVRYLEVPIVAAGFAVIAAGALQLAAQQWPLAAYGMVPRLRLWHPAVGRLLALMAPAVLGASVFQLNLLLSRVLASFLGEGAVSYLYYADRLIEFPLGVFVVAIGTASLPSFSRLVAAGRGVPLRRAFSGALGLALALTVPATVGLVMLREAIFGALFAWRPAVFGGDAVEGCAYALLFYAFGLVPIAVSRTFVNLCIAHEDTRTPARAAVVSLFVNALASLALIGPLPPLGLPDLLARAQNALVVADLGFAGLAAASSLAAAANALYLAAASAGRHRIGLGREDADRLWRLGVAAAGMALVLAALARLLPVPLQASPRAVGILTVHVALGAAAYGAGLRAARSPDLAPLLVALHLRRPAGGSPPS